MAAVEEGILYMIQELNKDGTANGYFKAGTTKNTDTRVRDLQTGNPRVLYLKHSLPVKDRWGAEAEAKLKLEPYKATLGGGTEWYYKPADQDWDYFQGVFYRIAAQFR